MQLLPRVEEAARTLMDAKCDVVCFHCTAASTEAGLAGEERALAAVMRGGATRATTTATALRNAFAALGARRLVLLTPYDARTTAEEAAFLAHRRLRGPARGRVRSRRQRCLLRHAGAVLARPHDRGRASGRGCLPRQLRQHRDLRVIAELEQRLDRPVVTSNQAMLWDALARLDWSDRRGCPGRLFGTATVRRSGAA